jgi:acetyl-CoA carboxylase biotin carboxyl carrier protein
MDIKEIKELLELIQDSGIEEFEMEKSGVRLRIRNSQPAHLSADAGAVASPAVAVGAPQAVAAQAEAPAEEPEEDLYVFKAPIVGTFYLTPKPDAEAFVQVGDYVTKNSIVCIIEAMKIFNQIESDVSGEIVSILVENGQPVEYGEPLFKIRLTKSA